MIGISDNTMYGFIYITTNLINGKRYVGQRRFDNSSRWKSYIGSGTYLKNAVDKYGKENFKRIIVSFGESAEELNKDEFRLIEYLDAVTSENYYNLIEGGDVSSGLGKSNSVPVVCIDNDEVFNSIIDAATYVKCHTSVIRESFTQNHTHEYRNEKPIFRRLDSVPNIEKMCSMCGVTKNGVQELKGRKICRKCNAVQDKQRKVYKSKRRKEKRKENRMNEMFGSMILDMYKKYLSISDIESIINKKEVNSQYIKEILIKNQAYIQNRTTYYRVVHNSKTTTFKNTNEMISWVYLNVKPKEKSMRKIKIMIDKSIVNDDKVFDSRFELFTERMITERLER